MELEKLEIELMKYGPNAGKYEARVKYQNSFGASVQIPLGEEVSKKILEVIADQIVEASNSIAKMMTSELIESLNEKLIESR